MNAYRSKTFRRRTARSGPRTRLWRTTAVLSRSLVGALALTGCERIIDVEVDEGPTRLVVEGRIELVKENPSPNQKIRLTTTDDFFSNAPAPPATGAVVTVQDDLGAMTPFVEGEPGIYTTSNLDAEIGRTYTLTVEWNGDTYVSSATTTAVPPIEQLYFVFEEESIISEEEGYRATIDYTDPAGVANYYLWELIVDGQNTAFPDPGNAFNLISEDEFYDGQAVTEYQPNDEVALELGQDVVVRQIALSAAAFDYYLALFEQNALGSGDPFSIPPANVRGNVANTTSAERYALGYFEAAEVSVARSIVIDDGS